MIPLNKPGRVGKVSTKIASIEDLFMNRSTCYLTTASDALNVIFRLLYEERGPMRIGVSPLTCFQAIYPIVTNGHIPVFLDVDPDTLNIDTGKLVMRDDIQSLAVIHLGGNPNEMDVIEKYAHERKIPVIEDCAQALGSKYDGRYLGSFGSFAAFSLIKNLHVPSGGLLLSDTDISPFVKDAPSRTIMLKQYRKIKIWLESNANHKPHNVWNWLYGGLMSIKKDAVPNDAPGYLLSRKEIEDVRLRFGSFEALYLQRLSNAKKIIGGIDPLRAMVQQVLEKGSSNRNRILFRIRGRNAFDVIKALRNKGIAANNLTQNYKCGFQPHVSEDVLLGRYYSKRNLEAYDSVFSELVAVPSSPFLTDEEIGYITYSLNEIIS